MHRLRSRSAGFTLVQMVITVAIAAILMRIGFASYRTYVVRGYRAAAVATLHSLTSRMEAQGIASTLNNTGYATDFFTLVNVGTSGNTQIYLSPDGSLKADTSSGPSYQLTLTTTGTPATAYQFSAVPLGRQAKDDAACGTLSVDSTGRQTISGTGNAASCWGK